MPEIADSCPYQRFYPQDAECALRLAIIIVAALPAEPEGDACDDDTIALLRQFDVDSLAREIVADDGCVRLMGDALDDQEGVILQLHVQLADHGELCVCALRTLLKQGHRIDTSNDLLRALRGCWAKLKALFGSGEPQFADE